LACHESSLIRCRRANLHFALELHLRCLIASLRLLAAHGIQEPSTALSADLVEKSLQVLSLWQSFHAGQVEFDRRRGQEEETNNYNIEFLLSYAKDVICSVAMDQSVVPNIANRIAVLSAALDCSVFA